ncbi:MAG: hypothetical protein AB7Q16_22755 [Vicinamibacterales bacterium]
MSTVQSQGTRVVRRYRQTIDAVPAVVFPLLCPERETEWLDGWRYRMVHSASGLAEDGAVFTTPQAGEPDTVWIVVRHDAAARAVAFARVTPGLTASVLTIAVSPHGPAQSHVDVAYTYTALTPAGEQWIAAWTDEAFLAMMTFWERSMNHFLKTGARLPAGR